MHSKQRFALLADIRNIAIMMREAGIPKRLICRWKVRTIGQIDAETVLCDFHARIPTLIKEVRHGNLDKAAHAVGKVHGLVVGMNFDRKNSSGCLAN